MPTPYIIKIIIYFNYLNIILFNVDWKLKYSKKIYDYNLYSNR